MKNVFAVQDEPPAQWLAWAQNEMFLHDGDCLSDYHYLPRLVRARTVLAESLGETAALPLKALQAIFHNAWSACGQPLTEYAFTKMLRYAVDHHRVLEKEPVIDADGAIAVGIRLTPHGRRVWLCGAAAAAFADLYRYPSFPTAAVHPMAQRIQKCLSGTRRAGQKTILADTTTSIHQAS